MLVARRRPRHHDRGRPGVAPPRIGTRLLLALARRGDRARAARALTLEVRVSNDGAQALYRRFGFAPAGVRKGYYVETNEDALVMWAHDVDAPDVRASGSTRIEAERRPARPSSRSWRP